MNGFPAISKSASRASEILKIPPILKILILTKTPNPRRRRLSFLTPLSSLFHAYALRENRGSSVSRKPSPTKFIERTLNDRNSPGKNVTQTAIWR